MASRLSHSAIARYQTCGRSYFYHYKKRLRPTTTSGALLFGSAMDAALNELATTKNLEGARKAFEAEWHKAKVGNKNVVLAFCEDIVYAASDCDLELLTNDDVAALEAAMDSRGFQGNIEILYETILEAKKRRGWANLSAKERQWYNYANWLSLRAKGHIMLTAYNERILPMFKEVLASQLEYELKNDDGDSIIGFIDLVVKLHDGRVVIFDNKTSSIEYAEDSVKRSQQLALYKNGIAGKFPTEWAGYVVIRKGIIKNRSKMCKVCAFEAERGARHKTCTNEIEGKRCGGEWTEWINPDADINVLIDSIPKATEDLIMENCADITHLINQEAFPRNLNSCKMPWGDCAYMKLCWEGSEEGLEVVPEDEKK